MDILPFSKIRELAKALEDAQDQVAELSEVVKAAMDTIGEHRMVKSAFKLAVCLKNMDAAKQSDWLRTFDQVREALGLDDQLDLVDAIEADQAKAAHVDPRTVDSSLGAYLEQLAGGPAPMIAEEPAPKARKAAGGKPKPRAPGVPSARGRKSSKTPPAGVGTDLGPSA
jgi:hypothetical protein